MASRYDDCIKKMLAAAGGKMTQAEAKSVLQELEQRVGRQKAITQANSVSKELNLRKFVDEQSKNLFDAKKLQALRDVKMAFEGKRAFDGQLAFIEKGGFNNPVDGLHASMDGIQSNKTGARNGTYQRQTANIDLRRGQFMNDLKRGGVRDLFFSDKAALETMKEWEQLSLERTKGKSNFGITGNKDAMRMAEVINKHALIVKQGLEDAGALVGDVYNYYGNQSHDPILIEKAKFEQWKKDIMPTINQAETFPHFSPERIDEALHESYVGITTGEHFEANTATGELEKPRRNIKGGNLQNRVGSSRKFVFNSPEDFYGYFKKYGTRGGSFRDSILSYLDHGSSNAVLFADWGPNPRATFDSVRRHYLMSERYKGSKEVSALKNLRLDNIFRVVSGESRIPANVFWAKTNAAVRNTFNVSLLGSSVITSFGDIVTQGTTRNFWGMPMMEAYRDFATTTARAGKDRWAELFGHEYNSMPQEVARSMGAGLEGVMGKIHAVYGLSEDWELHNASRKLSAVQNTISGQNAWDDITGIANNTSLSSYMAHVVENRPDLTPQIKRLLNLYDINDNQFAVFQKTLRDTGEGFKIYVPEEFHSLPDSDIAGYLKAEGESPATKEGYSPRQLRQARSTLELNFVTMFADQRNYGLPRPDAATIALFASDPAGTFKGEFWRHLGMLKSFNFSFFKKIGGRELFMREGAERNMAILHSLVALPMCFAGITSLKNLSQGKKPPDYFNINGDKSMVAKNWAQALASSGAFNIYGDFLLNEASYTSSSAQIALGPSLGTGFQLVDAANRGVRGKEKLIQIEKVLDKVTPFSRLWWARGGMDYLLKDNLYEITQPGYLEKYEKTMKKNGQEYYLPPSQNTLMGKMHNAPSQ